MKRVLTVMLIAMLIAVMVAPVWATDDSLDETSGERTISTAEMEAKVAEALRKGIAVRDGWRGEALVTHTSSHPLEYMIREDTPSFDYEEHLIYCAKTNCEAHYINLGTEAHEYHNECESLQLHKTICDKCGIWFDDQLSNQHSLYYIDYNAEKHKIACYNCDYITAIPRQQNHSFSAWTSTGSTQHKHTCDKCGRVVMQNHVWGDWLDYSSSQHRRTCSTCGQTATQAHNYSGYKYYSTTQHRKQCQTSTCGHYSTPVSHTFGSWSSYSSTQHRRKCSGCSYYAYANHSFNYSGGELVCSTCGYSKPYGN